MNEARDYQILCEDMVREAFAQGHKKVLLVLPTGAGKTFIFCRMIKKSKEKGSKPGLVVRGRELVDQASKRLFREGVDHGVLMANHWNFKPTKEVQACSIDTLISRDIGLDRFGFLVVDEGHLFSPRSEGGRMIKDFKGYCLTVTATPYPPGGMRHLADVMIRPTSMQALTDEGYLVPFRIFAPSQIDTSSVKVSSSTHDYVTADLEKVTITGELTAKIVDTWKALGENRATIFFALNIKHSKLIAEKFRESGISAEHCDADTSKKEREEILKRSKSGETKIICNVGILCTGVDMPWISCIIMGRKTKSLNLFIQQAGRGTRIYDNKYDCILLDHAGNAFFENGEPNHGHPAWEPEVDLDGNVSDTHKMESKICKQCFAVYRGPACPSCGRTAPLEDPSKIIEKEGILKEIKITASSPMEHWLEYLEGQRKKHNHAPKWTYYQLLKKFDYSACEALLPEWFRIKYKKKLFEDEENPFAGSPFRKGWNK